MPPQVFAQFRRLERDALRMKSGWPGKTYALLCQAESAGLLDESAMDELEAMLLEWA